MLDISYIRDNPDSVREACANKNLNPQVVNNLLDIDVKRRGLIKKVEEIRAKRNLLHEKLKKERTDELIKESKDLKNKLQDLEPELKKVKATFLNLMLQIPNIPLKDVPIGKNETANVVAHTWGKKPQFNFKPKDHIELGVNLDILDLERGSKVAGFRGYFLKNEGVILQMALMRYALDRFIAEGFTPIIPPVINKRNTLINTGLFPWGEREAYKLGSDETDASNDYFLAGTAEVPLVSYYANETLREKDLPIKMVGYSPCYRREIGNYGKDTKGFFRVHEFWKVEQVILCKNDLEESLKWHETMLEFSEKLLQDLGFHYQVMLMCTGDMGEPQAKKYDIETWMPGRDSYGETASASIMTDFQSRRAAIRYQASDGTLKYVHMLNNTAIPSARTLIAIWENFQQEDGSIKIPEPLVKYTGFKKIKPRK